MSKIRGLPKKIRDTTRNFHAVKAVSRLNARRLREAAREAADAVELAENKWESAVR